MTSPDTWNKIKRIFHEASELEPELRLGHIRSECGDDPEARAELECLIESIEPARGFIEEPIFSGSAPLVGKSIGRYRIVREIGRGGMGVVLLAEREGDEFRQLVAIKVLKRVIDSDQLVRRFNRERQILALLNHPNIARLIDGGATDDGLPYFVMEYVEGLPLMKYCTLNGLSANERIRLFRDICSAVSYAHGLLIVHRDLKPSNIIVTPEGNPKLLDFGIAKTLGEEPGATALTGTLNRVLTPEYASPEQVRGDEITTAGDVYSLGVVLYELLTGGLPYQFTTRSPQEVFRLVCEAEPVFPAKIDGSRLDSDLRNIILFALRKEPWRRYASVEKLSDDLRRYREHLPVAARADTIGYRARKFVQRNKLAAGAGILVFLSLVGGTAAIAWEAEVAREHARVANEERNKSLTAQVRAEKINKFMQSIFAYANPDWFGRANGRKDVSVLEAMRDIEKHIPADFADDPELQADVYQQIGDVYRTQKLSSDAERNLREALRIRTAIFGEDNAKVAESMYILSGVYNEQGNAEESYRLLADALAIQRRHPNETNNFPFMLTDYGSFRVGQYGDFETAADAHRQALELFRTRFGPAHPLVYSLHGLLGRDYLIGGDLQQAEKEASESVSGGGAIGSDILIDIALRRGDLQAAERELGRYSEMLKQNPPDIAYLPSLSLVLAKLAFARGNFVEAAALVARERDPRPGSEALNFTADNIRARSELALGRAERAESIIRSALASLGALRNNDLIRHELNATLGECLTAGRKTREGTALLFESHGWFESRFGPDDARTVELARRLSAVRRR